MTHAASGIPNFDGRLPAAFSAVGDAFADNFASGEEIGAAFAVFIEGECVIDIWAGHRERARTSAWEENTLVSIYSTGKAALAFLAARALSDGLLRYDAPIAEYWPEFAANGKAAITVAKALSHQDGLAAIPDDEMPPATWLDWEAVTARIAAMAPLWPPGTANGYHPQTFGFIIGEILRRVTGKSVGALLRETGYDVLCGIGPADFARAAPMRKPPRAPDLGPITEIKRLAFLAKSSAASRVSPEEWAAAEIPGSNMHANARGLAALAHPLANDGADVGGETVLTSGAIDEALRERVRGDDLVLPFTLAWAGGLMRNINGHYGPNENAYGHSGFGGSCVVIDPDRRMTAAYVMNQMSPTYVGDPRAMGLLNAVYGCF